MEPKESDIEKAAGAIIDELGINALTVDALALQVGVPKNELPGYLKNEDDILKFLALRLENEMQQLINNLVAMHHGPDEELADLFMSLDDFYNRKSHFLELMFADVIHKNGSAVQTILVGIRKIVGNYLAQIIEQGKKTGIFNARMDTKHEVDAILNRFRFFMSDLPMTHKMIRDLKTIRENGE